MGFGSAVRSDLEARAPWYGDDWKEGFNSGFRFVWLQKALFVNLKV